MPGGEPQLVCRCFSQENKYICSYMCIYTFGHLYILAIFEGDFHLQFRATVKYYKSYGTKQALTYEICLVTYWSETQGSIEQAHEVLLIPAHDSHFPHH